MNNQEYAAVRLFRLTFWNAKWDLFLMNSSNSTDDSAQDRQPKATLKALTPKYEEDRHGVYLGHLEAAVANKEILNIALAGPYGSGKSSILSEFVRRRDRARRRDRDEKRKYPERVITLSMSTLGGEVQSAEDTEVPEQALTKTNVIQQEIVKQLLYRENPQTAPASRFRRIEKFRFWPNILLSSIAGILVASTSSILGWDASLLSRFGVELSNGRVSLVVFALSVVAFSAVIFALLWFVRGRINIKQLSLPSATVSLEKDSISYFDQYLDEIVYYFESSGTEIVILEDIDRFEDPHIFETLLALNTLVNNAPQVQQTVQFIYAVKDSMFAVRTLKGKTTGVSEPNSVQGDRVGRRNKEMGDGIAPVKDPVAAELDRANRTKFFGIIIPVVPFATYQNSRDLIDGLMDGVDTDVNKVDQQRFDRLFAIAGENVPDMRILKNVHNEYVVYRSVVFPGNGPGIGLSKPNLFAMVLYKNVHLTDFEKIPSSGGSLNTLYDRYLEFKSLATKQQLDIKQRLSVKGVSSLRSEERAASLGQQLIGNISRHPFIRDSYGNFNRITIYNPVTGATSSEPESLEFWDIVAEIPEEGRVSLSGSGYAPTTGKFSDIRSMFDGMIDNQAWLGLSREDQALLAYSRKILPVLRVADFKDLYQEKALKVILNDVSDNPITFAEVVEATLPSRLSRTLVAEGFIDRNFVLYTSAFYGRVVSVNAARFQIMHLQYERPDYGFALEDEDAETVLRENSARGFKNPAMRNFDLVSFVLRNSKVYEKQLTEIISELSALGGGDRQFIGLYLENEHEAQETSSRLVAELSPQTAEIFDVIADTSLEDPRKMKLVSTAFESIVADVDYPLSEKARELITSNLALVSPLVCQNVSDSRVDIVVSVLVDNGVIAMDLSGLSSKATQALASLGAFEIHRQNLLAISGDSSVALDVLKAANSDAFEHVGTHLGEYLEALDEGDDPISVESDLPEILNSLGEFSDTEDTIKLVERAGLEVGTLRDVEDVDLWTVVISSGQAPAHVVSMDAYISECGIDATLIGRMLRSGIVAGEENREVSDRILQEVLKRQDLVERDEDLVQLVRALLNGHRLTSAEVPAVANSHIPVLVQEHLLEDNAETYQLLQDEELELRVAYGRSSRKMAEFMDEALVPPSDASALVQDSGVSLGIRRQIVSSLDSYLPQRSKEDLESIIEVAKLEPIDLAFNVLLEIAAHPSLAEYSLWKVGAKVEELSDADVRSLLSAISGKCGSIDVEGIRRWTWSRTESCTRIAERAKELGIVTLRGSNGTTIFMTEKQG